MTKLENDIVDYSAQFYKPQGAYFLTHSIGLMPRSIGQCLEEQYLKPWKSADQNTWPKWLEAIHHFTGALATLFNSDADLFCPQTNVSSGLAKVIQSLPKRKGRTVIVASESDFPSAGFVLQQAERYGYTLKLIPKTADLQSPEVWDQALSDDVHSVFITHVVYNINAKTPIEQITKIAKQRGITSIIDVAQSSGIVPIDLSELDADIIVGSCIKWLCGGPGAGFLWVRRSLIEELKPSDVGWFSHQNPFEFDIDNFEYHNSAARFWGGTPSVAAYISASNSIELINTIGISNIQKHNRALTELIRAAVPAECISSPLDPTLKGGTIVLKLAEQASVEQRMLESGIHFDSRQYGIRLSPHIYNTAEEVNELIDCFD